MQMTIDVSEDDQIAMIALPYPPSVNGMYAGMGKRRHLRPEVVRFRADVQYAVLSRVDRLKFPIVGNVGLWLVAFRPNDKRKRDLDNLFKATLDALQHARVFCDDSQVKSIYSEFKPPHASERAGILHVSIFRHREPV